MAARGLVQREVLLALLDSFETIERPLVMHCKSGADRAGLASALYLLHIEGATIAEAKKQLSFRYLHIRGSKTGILDHLLECYEADTAARPIPIRDWIESRYDRDQIIESFRSKKARRPT